MGKIALGAHSQQWVVMVLEYNRTIPFLDDILSFVALTVWRLSVLVRFRSAYQILYTGLDFDGSVRR